MGKTSHTVTQRYQAKTYERLAVNVYSGEKELISRYAKGQGKSVNKLIHDLLNKEMGGILREMGEPKGAKPHVGE